MKFLFNILFLLIVNFSFSQEVKWNFIDDSLTLSPNRLVGTGSFSIRKNNPDNVQVSGKLTLLLNDEILFFEDSGNMFKLKFNDIEFINLDGVPKVITSDNLNNKNYKDSLIQYYRANLYRNLQLNEVLFLFSKKNKYEISDGTLSVKKPMYLKGKLCSISPLSMVVLTEDGELIKAFNGEFINLSFKNFKTFECNGLYEKIYYSYINDVDSLRVNYQSRIKEKTIDEIVGIIGPFDKQQSLPSGNRIYIWDKPEMKQIFSLNTNTFASSNSFSTSSTYLNNNYSINNPIVAFNYGNKFTNINSTSSQSGSISYVNQGAHLSITIDASNKIINVYQERILNKPEYGTNFKFINF